MTPCIHQLRSPRLLARCWSPDDAPAFRRLLDDNDRHLRPFIPWMRHEPLSEAATRARLEDYRRRLLAGEDFRYALCEIGHGHLIGELMLSTRSGSDSREVGYLLDRRHTGRGLASEATAMALQAAFRIAGVARVELHCSPDNAPSVRLAERLGFRLDRILADHAEDSEGVRRDLMIWMIDAATFAATSWASLEVQARDAEDRPLALR